MKNKRNISTKSEIGIEKYNFNLNINIDSEINELEKIVLRVKKKING